MQRHLARFLALGLVTLALWGCGSEASSIGDADGSTPLDLSGLDLGGDAGLDVPFDNGGTPDGAGDTGPDAPETGKFGAPCQGNQDCDSTFCVPTPNGQVCTELCVDECPAGWTCKGILNEGTDPTFICVPVHATLCDPCHKHSDCSSTFTGEGNYCLQIGEQGKFCGGTCDTFDCPAGYTCENVTVDGQPRRQCLPDAAQCECSTWAKEHALSTTCEFVNDWGTCVGERTCSLAGLQPCNAAPAEKEVCNGADDNCDNIVDNITTPEPCSTHNEWGTCPGVILCGDTGQGTCNAPTPAQDICDGQDNDCDAATDEDFPDTDGDHLANCIDPDDDSDGIADEIDNCPLDLNADQADFDGDLQGDACDPDDDNDSAPDVNDCDPENPQVSPYLVEVCDGLDNDCKNGADDGLCDDGNTCTDDICHADGTCTYAPNTKACDDQSVCTTGDVCNNGVCLGQGFLDCDDGKQCTEDLCNPASGCYHSNKADNTPCEDGNFCTENDGCFQGSCMSGSLKNCNDNNPCTQEQCSPTQGCVYANAPAGTPCDDGSACTIGDVCGGGACTPGDPMNCTASCPPGTLFATCIEPFGTPSCICL